MMLTSSAGTLSLHAMLAGISFTFLPLAQSSIALMMVRCT
jgi:hypothetical protein